MSQLLCVWDVGARWRQATTRRPLATGTQLKPRTASWAPGRQTAGEGALWRDAPSGRDGGAVDLDGPWVRGGGWQMVNGWRGAGSVG